MIYKIGDTVYEIKENEIKPNLIQDFKFVTWIQVLKIDGKWQPASKYFATAEEAKAQINPVGIKP